MKGRSSHHQRPAATAEQPHADDWANGSWTVDCSCGVTFDDGEEMVSCDECGVWVHTRCARFVRGDASFACHNCKVAKRLRSGLHPCASNPSGDAEAEEEEQEEEETEVAQLLAELPNKTASCPPPPCPNRPRLHAEIPLEERVHVQGVPGGDPAMFEGFSSVFTSQLWKCTGYVPKKFNFHYREFSCWDDDDKGANMLFNLSKENFPFPPVTKVDEFHKKGFSGGKLSSNGDLSMSSGKKERSRSRVSVMHHSAKRRKEELGEGREFSSDRKKARRDYGKSIDENKRRGL